MKTKLMILGFALAASNAFAGPEVPLCPAPASKFKLQELRTDISDNKTVIEALVNCETNGLAQVKVTRVGSGSTSHSTVLAAAFIGGSLPIAEIALSQTSKTKDAVFSLPNNAVMALAAGQAITLNFSVLDFVTGSTAIELK